MIEVLNIEGEVGGLSVWHGTEYDPRLSVMLSRRWSSLMVTDSGWLFVKLSSGLPGVQPTWAKGRWLKVEVHLCGGSSILIAPATLAPASGEYQSFHGML